VFAATRLHLDMPSRLVEDGRCVNFTFLSYLANLFLVNIVMKHLDGRKSAGGYSASQHGLALPPTLASWRASTPSDYSFQPSSSN
jgi:hypothetical protein